jgi:hypothetical protein
MEANPVPSVQAEYETAILEIMFSLLCDREWAVVLIAWDPAYDDLRARLRAENAARRAEPA